MSAFKDSSKDGCHSWKGNGTQKHGSVVLVNGRTRGKPEIPVHRYMMGMRNGCVYECTGGHVGTHARACGHTHCAGRLACSSDVEEVDMTIFRGFLLGIMPPPPPTPTSLLGI